MLNKILKEKKAFTFIEAMVIIIIIGICVVMWGFYGRDHIKVSMMNEARMFTEKIVGQEKIYYADHGCFYRTEGLHPVQRVDILSIEAKENKYFKTFKITRPASTLGTVVVDLYIDSTKYRDFTGYSIKGIYLADKDTIKYDETYGS